VTQRKGLLGASLLITLFVLAALVGRFAAAQTATAQPDPSDSLCANRSGNFEPYEGNELWFTNTYYSRWQMEGGDTFNVMRRRPDYTVAWSSPYERFEAEFENSVDVNRRSEMGRNGDFSYCCAAYGYAQWAKGGC
jgi:hypothetical protein